MRIERAIDALLDWRQLERDATPRSIDSYQRVLWKLAKEYPEADLRALTTADLRAFLKGWVRESEAVRGIDLSGATRSNIISVLHSFFSWAEAEDIIEFDPSRKIRRPRKRRPEIYRPSLDELRQVRAAAHSYERPAILLMEGIGHCAAQKLSAAAGPTWISCRGGFMCAAREVTGNGSRCIRTY